MFRKGKNLRWTIKIRYLIVQANTSYNILLGRPFLNHLEAIVSTPYLAMKFPSVSGDIIIVHVDQKVTREFYEGSLKVEPTNGEWSKKNPLFQRGSIRLPLWTLSPRGMTSSWN